MKGPWELKNFEAGTLSVVREDGRVVARVSTRNRTAVTEPTEDEWADGHVIAAAIDMLQALELVQMSNGWRYLSPEAQSLINGVVAKAKGEA